MVRAGEAGGILDDILKKLALQQEKDAKIRAKFKSAMTYPTILLSITGIVFIGLMTIVMPKIGGIVEDLSNGAPLPTITVVMLAISNFMTTYWYILIGSIFGTFFGLRRYTKTPKGRIWRDRTLMKVPVLKQVIVKVAVARFSRIFASLMGAGVSVLDALEVTGHAIGNSVLEEELQNAAKMVANGAQLSQPLGESKVFPAIVSQMLGVGEETGQIDEVLLKVAEFYEDEVDATVESLSSILEPIMIVVMGTMVGLIAASVISPISNLSNQI
jgi:type IV pilus assembly protein PilC